MDGEIVSAWGNSAGMLIIRAIGEIKLNRGQFNVAPVIDQIDTSILKISPGFYPAIRFTTL
jgi:hypothetical protein